MSIDIKLQAEGQCRLCERPKSERKLTKHRLVPGRRPWLGRYVRDNVVPLCWPCHVAVEHSVSDRRMLRPKLWPVEVAYAIKRMGNVVFNDMYPMPAVHDYPLARNLRDTSGLKIGYDENGYRLVMGKDEKAARSMRRLARREATRTATTS